MSAPCRLLVVLPCKTLLSVKFEFSTKNVFYSAILMLKYGLLLNDAAMIKVNVAAIVLNTIYSVFFYKFAEDKYEEVLKPTSYGVALLAVLLGYAQLESSENIEYRFGLILTLLMLALLGAPLLDVVSVW